MSIFDPTPLTSNSGSNSDDEVILRFHVAAFPCGLIERLMGIHLHLSIGWAEYALLNLNRGPALQGDDVRRRAENCFHAAMRPRRIGL